MVGKKNENKKKEMKKKLELCNDRYCYFTEGILLIAVVVMKISNENNRTYSI